MKVTEMPSLIALSEVTTWKDREQVSANSSSHRRVCEEQRQPNIRGSVHAARNVDNLEV